VFQVEGDILQGQLVAEAGEVYLTSSCFEVEAEECNSLQQEMAAWDRLSDESWASLLNLE
jgi:hypothetical protein